MQYKTDDNKNYKAVYIECGEMEAVKTLAKQLVAILTAENEPEDRLVQVTSFLNKAEPHHQRMIIMYELEDARYDDIIHMAMMYTEAGLLKLLLSKLDDASVINLLNNGHLLIKAISSQCGSILVMVLELILKTGNETQLLGTKDIDMLKKQSWDSRVVKKMYELSDGFFIPIPQGKAKMVAIIAYNKFESPASGHSPRSGADQEATCITEALETVGFKGIDPLIDWTNVELLQHIRTQIENHGSHCSLLFICVMSHGHKGVVYDKNGIKGEINQILDEVEKLPNYIPVVLVLQCCQGEDEPTQSVDVTLSDGHLQSDPDPSPGSENMPPDSHVVLKRANTVVITATPRGFMARRNHLIPHLAAEIRKSDGKTSFNTMHIRASDAMAKHHQPEYKAQAPQYTDQLRKQLIFPAVVRRDSALSTDSGTGSTEQINDIG